jgi:hypothetical protein
LNMVRKISFLLVALVALLLAACGGGGAGTTTNNTSSAATLSETYDADGITFKYPSGWVVQAAAAPGAPIMLANGQATLDALSTGSNTAAASGQQAIVILPLTGDSAAALTATATTPIDLLKQMGPGMASGGGGFTLGDPTEVTIGGNPAAQATGTGDSGDGKIIMLKLGDTGYAMVMGVTAKGELGNIEGTVDGVAATVAVK